MPVEIEKEAQKCALPGPGAYEAKLKSKVLGAFNLKCEKYGFIEEAQFIGQ